MNYGIPYMGSKSSIVSEVMKVIPSAENFYDLFGGGGCVTHFAVKRCSRKYKYFHYNEIKKDVADLFRDAVEGKYNYKRFKPAWVSREEFNKNKDSCAYTRLIWSFGNSQKNYLFGVDIEERKKSLHNAVIFEEFNDQAKSILGFEKWPECFSSIKLRRLFIREIERLYYKNRTRSELQQLQQLERLQQLQQLERLKRLEQLERISITSCDYSEVPIKENSILYCDIPYKCTGDYGNNFDHKRFFDWAANNKSPVYISEFDISDSRFKEIFRINKKQKLRNIKGRSRKVFIEKVYCNEAVLLKLKS